MDPSSFQSVELSPEQRAELAFLTNNLEQAIPPVVREREREAHEQAKQGLFNSTKSQYDLWKN